MKDRKVLGTIYFVESRSLCCHTALEYSQILRSSYELLYTVTGLGSNTEAWGRWPGLLVPRNS
jgi:hypothetical protein